MSRLLAAGIRLGILRLQASNDGVAPDDQAPDSTERPSDSEPIADPSPDLMDPLESASIQPAEPLRAKVQGCGREVLLGSCEDVAQIELRDISWTVSEGAIVVTGTGVGEGASYQYFGISPAHAADDEALGVGGESDFQAATLQLYAVSDDVPTPISVSLMPTGSAGNYQVIVWASRLEGECARPLEILDVTWP